MQTDDSVTGPMNLGNPVEFTMLKLAEQVLKATSSKSKLVFHALPADDPQSRRPDISYAQTVIGWEPTVQLETGLRKTIEYFDTLLKNGRA
jgi:UDP-glucuronate decarboxylase